MKKKYKEEDWKAAIDKSLECGACDAAVIESIIKMLHAPNKKVDEKAVLDRLGKLSITVPIWDCKLSGYAILSKSASLEKKRDLTTVNNPGENVVNPITNGVSRHGNAMLGVWNGPIADQIMDDYYNEKRCELASAGGK